MAKLDKSLFEKINQQTESVQPPIQKTVPVKKSKLNDEEPFTLWIKKDVKKKLKIKSAETGYSIKDMISMAIDRYLENAE